MPVALSVYHATDAGVLDGSAVTSTAGDEIEGESPSRPRRRLRRGTSFLVAAIVLAGALALAFVAARNADVVAEGALLEYTDATIKEVRFFDRYTFYVEAEARSDKDAAVSALLVAVAAMALLVTAFFSSGTVRARPIDRRFHAATLVGAGYLAADEFLGIHETLGHNLRFLADLPAVQRPDDAIVALYAVAFLAFLVAFRSAILASRRALALFVSGFLVFAAAAALDVLDVGVDEYLEPLAALVFFAGLVVLSVEHLAAAADRPV
jgi:hypothetical protein